MENKEKEHQELQKNNKLQVLNQIGKFAGKKIFRVTHINILNVAYNGHTSSEKLKTIK